MRQPWTSLLLTSLCFTVVGRAQGSATAGAMKGIVFAKDNQLVESGTVTIKNLETGYSRTVQLETLGYFGVPLVPVGTYQITVKVPGYQTYEGRARVTLGETTNINPEINREAVVSATVEIVGTAAGVDTTQVNLTTSMDEKAFESIPLVSRNFQDVARMTPGVVAGAGSPPRLVSQGGRQIFNGIQIDGANNNSGFFGEQRGAAYQPFTFGLDTIRELQIITNGYDAQYGSAGATVNAITKGGTNEFAGTAMAEFRRNSLTAKSKPVPYDPNRTINVDKNLIRTNDSRNIGFTYGGPIIKDKLFFFVGAEQFKKEVNAQPPLQNLSGAGNTAADFNNFAASPLASAILSKHGLTLLQEFGNPVTGVQPASYPLTSDNKVFFGRLDYNLNTEHRFVGRVNYTRFEDILLNTSNSPNNAESNILATPGLSAISWVVESNNIWTPNIFTESRLQIANERRPFRGNGIGPAVNLQGTTGLAAGNKTSSPRESNEVSLQLTSNTTWLMGDWTFKGGVDYTKFDVDNQFFNNGQGRFLFTTYAIANAWARGTIDNTAATTGNITYSGAVGTTAGRIQMNTKITTAFISAQYQGLLSKRLTLNGGLRYTNQVFSDNPMPNPNLQGLDKGFGGNATDPRISFSLDLDGKGKTALKGGYGYFTSPTPLLLHSNTMTGNGQLITNYSFALGANPVARNATIINIFNGAANPYGSLGANPLLQGATLAKADDATLASIAGSGLFGAAGSPTSVWDPNNKLSRAKKASLSLDHDMGDGLSIGIAYAYTIYENLQDFVDINLNQLGGHAYLDGYAKGVNTWSTAGRPNTAVVGGRTLDFRPGSLAPGNPTGGFSGVYLVKADGYGRYRGLTFKVEKHWSADIGIQANLTFSKAEDTSTFERGTYSSGSLTDPYSELGGSLSRNPADIGASFGPSNNDRFMVFNALAYHPVYWGIQASWRFLYQSGLPYSAFTDTDINGDGMQNEFAFGTRGSQRQADERQIDLRLNRVFKIVGKFEVEGIIDIYNLFNWQTPLVDANLSQALPGVSGASTFATRGGVAQAVFGQATIPAQNTREVQLGIRVKF